MKKVFVFVVIAFALASCEKRCINITDKQGQELCTKCFKSEVEYNIWFKKYAKRSPEEKCAN